MVKLNGNKEFTVEDYLKDIDFVLWCVGRQSDSHWEQWAARHRGDTDFQRAVRIASRLKPNPLTLRTDEKEELYGEIVSDHRKLMNKLTLRRELYRRLTAVAAVAMIIAAGSIVYLAGTWGPKKETSLPTVAAEADGSMKLFIGGETVEIRSSVAKIDCIEGGGYRINGSFHVSSGIPGVNTRLVVPRDKMAKVSLEDGSKVWVNSGSEFVFPSCFERDARKVSIEGEAYFEIEPESARPFIVESKLFSTRVLGTAFAVNSPLVPSSKNYVVLAEGSVEVTMPDIGRTVVLTPSEILNFDRNSYMVSSVETDKYIGWHQSMLTIGAESLEDIARQLSEYYGVRFECDPGAAPLMCSGRLVLFDSMWQTLDVLINIIPVRYTTAGDGTIVLEPDRERK